MKIAASSYSFSQLLNSGELTRFDFIRRAKDLGFDAVEFVDIIPHDDSSKEDYAKKLGDECARLDMPIANYTVGADFIAGSNGDLKAEIDEVCHQVNIAALLGAKSMRHDATQGFGAARGWRGFDDALPRLVEGCREVTEYAASFGIKTMVENHGFFCQDSVRVEKLVNSVQNENFGLLVDIGNFTVVDEDPAVAVGRTAPYALYVHAKDIIIKNGSEMPGRGFFNSRGGSWLRCTVLGHGNVPVSNCMHALKAAGYDGYVGIEFEGVEPAEWAMVTALENLRRILG